MEKERENVKIVSRRRGGEEEATSPDLNVHGFGERGRGTEIRKYVTRLAPPSTPPCLARSCGLALIERDLLSLPENGQRPIPDRYPRCSPEDVGGKMGKRFGRGAASAAVGLPGAGPDPVEKDG